MRPAEPVEGNETSGSRGLLMLAKYSDVFALMRMRHPIMRGSVVSGRLLGLPGLGWVDPHFPACAARRAGGEPERRSGCAA